jgi:hypothetical protein
MMQQRCFTDAPAGNPPEHFKFRARKGTLKNKILKNKIFFTVQHFILPVCIYVEGT